MSGYAALSCRCQNCNEFFLVKRLMENVINLDESENEKFFNHEVNKVKCKKCMSEFTFELPMVIFSTKYNFAIKVSPTLNPENGIESYVTPHYLVCSDFRFREVTYQIEAVEKAKIFLDGFDDRYIEYVKLTKFEDKDATPFDTNNVVYDHSDPHNLYFKKYDSDNNVTGNYAVPVSESDIPGNIYADITTNDKWKIINRYTMKKYITNGG